MEKSHRKLHNINTLHSHHLRKSHNYKVKPQQTIANMLRVMKQKLQQEQTVVKGDEAIPLASYWDKANAVVVLDSIHEDSTSSTTTTEQGRIVSHVPVSAMSSTSPTGSSDSTITSAHPFQALTQTEEEESPPNESPHSYSQISVGREDSIGRENTKNSNLKELDYSKRKMAEPLRSCNDHQQAKRPRHESLASSSTSRESLSSLGQTPVCLSRPRDIMILSPLHVFVRKQIEVFQATEQDLKQPAPGRRVPIQRGQVGLRCIHCKHQRVQERKKRALCYPSSVGRIYHSVSDMKFAHFPCSQMSQDLQQTFAVLKEESLTQTMKDKKESGNKLPKNLSASTAQYYHDSARELGMIDRDGGIYIRLDPPGKHSAIAAAPLLGQPQQLPVEAATKCFSAPSSRTLQDILLRNLPPPFALTNVGVHYQDQGATTKMQQPSKTSNKDVSKPTPPTAITTNSNKAHERADSGHKQELKDSKRAILASAMDQDYLTPIHCFVRKHVEVFAANQDDLAAPAPGRKTPIVLGQVGLRCIHCAGLPSKQRRKRAMCFPPSVSGVYHAVSNMKYDHFRVCQGLPEDAREEFQKISSDPSSSSSCSSAEGKRGNVKSRPRVSNSTAQYYHDSALRMGLCDTKEGIRFDNAISQQQSSPVEQNGEQSGRKTPSHEAEGMELLAIAATEHGQRRLSTAV